MKFVRNDAISSHSTVILIQVCSNGGQTCIHKCPPQFPPSTIAHGEEIWEWVLCQLDNLLWLSCYLPSQIDRGAPSSIQDSDQFIIFSTRFPSSLHPANDRGDICNDIWECTASRRSNRHGPNVSFYSQPYETWRRETIYLLLFRSMESIRGLLSSMVWGKRQVQQRVDVTEWFFHTLLVYILFKENVKFSSDFVLGPICT